MQQPRTAAFGDRYDRGDRFDRAQPRAAAWIDLIEGSRERLLFFFLATEGGCFFSFCQKFVGFVRMMFAQFCNCLYFCSWKIA